MSSNRAKGDHFADQVRHYLESQGISVAREYDVEVGFNSHSKRSHRFDLGNEGLLVECKSYSWTGGGNPPSAKFSTANEAMLYFMAAPNAYVKKLFFSKASKGEGLGNETLGENYVRRFRHMIPDGVEVWELDSGMVAGRQIWPNPTMPRIVGERSDNAARFGNQSEQNQNKEEATGTKPMMNLRIERITYDRGYFNVPVVYGDYVRMEEGDITLVLGGKRSIRGRVDRESQKYTKAPRIHGNKPLRDWIQENYSLYDKIVVRFDSPDQLTLG